ncbi:MAG: hypothetical protein A2Y25_02360 [Candidatus Melainabacteria bacterium GWF2_37_15]|nr:MAG: hypothetical protein A2Y25_02360 [Candidatus Melainabacteria bacterium GWF2_37_15]
MRTLQLNENEEILDKASPTVGLILGCYLFIFFVIASVIAISLSYNFGLFETIVVFILAYPLVHIFIYFLNTEVLLTTNRLIFKDALTLQVVDVSLNKINIVYKNTPLIIYNLGTTGAEIKVQVNGAFYKKYSVVIPDDSRIIENLINHIKKNIPRNNLNINKCKFDYLGN